MVSPIEKLPGGIDALVQAMREAECNHPTIEEISAEVVQDRLLQRMECCIAHMDDCLRAGKGSAAGLRRFQHVLENQSDALAHGVPLETHARQWSQEIDAAFTAGILC